MSAYHCAEHFALTDIEFDDVGIAVGGTLSKDEGAQHAVEILVGTVILT